jgi:hypothetical protein
MFFLFNLGLWYYLKLLYTISLGLEVGVVYGIIIFIYIFIKVMLFFLIFSYIYQNLLLFQRKNIQIHGINI